MRDVPSTNAGKLQRLSVRAVVIDTLQQIQEGQSLASLLDPMLDGMADKDKGFAHQLLLGTLRQWWALARIGERWIDNPVTDKGVLAGLHVGLYQLLYMQTPDHAAVGETVEAIKQLDKGYAAGLVNAILRKVQKNIAKYRKKTDKNHSLPNWLAKQIKQDWAAYYPQLGQQLRQAAPIFLRVNSRRCTVAAYSQLLNQDGIAHHIEGLTTTTDTSCIRLLDAIKITDLPKFAEGWVSVQDKHAQLAAHLLSPVLSSPVLSSSLVLQVPPASSDRQELRVLDACAAPGGKTAHLLEMFHMKHLSVLDNDNQRLQRVYDNLERLQLLPSTVTADNTPHDSAVPAVSTTSVTVVCDDARSFQGVEPEQPQGYDVILLDAPCSATGVLRRHPDIGLLRSEADITQTVQLQRQILDNLWQQLKVGGHLLYVTCSLLKAENEQQMLAFVQRHADAKAMDLPAALPDDNSIAQQIGRQYLPLTGQAGDGFYYALLQKQAHGAAR